MHQKLCLLHANCQGEELAALLVRSPAFTRAYRLVRYTNYTREPLRQEDLADCDIFLYQHLGPAWGDVSSEALLQRLRPGALALRIPNPLFKGYWPFWTNKSPIAFGDSLLDRLIDEGAPKTAILRIYLHGDIRAFMDLRAAFDQSIAIEEEKERDTCVKTVGYVLRHWKRRRLFHTINHPGGDLLLLLANGILEALGLPPLHRSAVQTPDAAVGAPFLPSYIDFDLPIHPQVAAFHGLAFGGPDSEYTVFSRRMTFEQYVSRYIDCRLNSLEKDFVSYLHLV